MVPELHLFILWDKARFIEKRVLDDLRNRVEVVWAGERRIEGEAGLFYRRVYGPSLPDSRRKVRNCGTGPYLLVVVRDDGPVYETADVNGSVKPRDAKLVEMKDAYRAWAGKGHRVHGTVDALESERDIRIFTGHGSEVWRAGVPPAESMHIDPPQAWGIRIPEGGALHIEAEAIWAADAAADGSRRSFLEVFGPKVGLSDIVSRPQKRAGGVFFTARDGAEDCAGVCVRGGDGCGRSMRDLLLRTYRDGRARPSAMCCSDDGRVAFAAWRSPDPELLEEAEATGGGRGGWLGRLAKIFGRGAEKGVCP